VPGRRHDSHPHASFPRTARVNQVLREVVADALERLADADDRLRMATVTAVDTTPDLRNATVFLSSLPPEMADALDAHRGALQRAIGHEVRLKRTPHLAFAPDPAVASGERVEEILRRLHDVAPAEGDGEAGDGGGDDHAGDAG
jgi:ribosome-binding factor A